VEVLACGDDAQVKAMIDWLWKGPPAAKVEGVVVEDAEAEPMPTGFSAR
jgi:acylphosphatase